MSVGGDELRVFPLERATLVPESAPGGLSDIPSVWCWLLHRVDDEDFDRTASIFEFQAQLFL